MSDVTLIFHPCPLPEETRWWTYHPRAFVDIDIDDVLEECDGLLSSHREYHGVTQNVSRRTCVFTGDILKAKKHLPGYYNLLFYQWEESSITLNIKERIEDVCGHQFDYALFHCYLDGTATIGYHNDKESLDGEIASVSVGCPRKFRIREIDQTKGYCAQYELGNGDFLVMKKGMQRLYKHSIIKELRITEPRCNWTFRNFPWYTR
jgi:hypothetical protein